MANETIGQKNDDIQEHEQALTDAFAAVIRAENDLSTVKIKHEELEAIMRRERAAADLALTDAWAGVKALLDETGEVSVTLPGAVTDYEIYRSTPRESVKVVDPAAVPDAFCKTERKPKLKEIGDYLRAQARANLPLPNWAATEAGESKLAWRAVKKRVKKK